jgi:1-aminocyclopropane-1-carboxylate deaminase/D-cysteine desulfhydrase-like pyridoxal-dependent ACC family enzyme
VIELKDPRHRLLTGPTPLQRLERTERVLGVSGLYVKRDDHMEIALGGNKLRSLEFWLGQALQDSADILLVSGGPASNLCRLTASAAVIAGIECIVLHNEDDNSITQRESFLNKILAASVHFLGPVTEEQRAVETGKMAGELRAQGRIPYIVGDEVIGALGYVYAAEELLTQSRENGANIRHVLLPGSMGSTEAGFIFGNTLLGNPFDVHLISVEYDEPELTACIEKIHNGLATHTGLGSMDYDHSRVHIHMDYLGDGYGKPSDAAEQAILRFARTEGIFLEHTYTAKTFAGFLDLVQHKAFPEGDGVCVIHTGGVPALFSQFSLFKTI